MQLLQERLDVREKTRSNIFNWRGQFTPQFADYILENFADNQACVLDPFSGSGTVLIEAARKNLVCYGYEINPAAYVMSMFSTFANMPVALRKDISASLETKMSGILQSYSGKPVYIDKPDYRESYANLIKFSRELLSAITMVNEKILALNILFLSEHDKRLTLAESIKKSAGYLRLHLFALPFANSPVTAYLKDARTVGHDLPAKVDVILTSPPYINVFNYHQNYRAIVEAVGFDVLQVALSEFGANRKNRGNRFKTVIQYCLDMELTLHSLCQALKPEGKLIMVVGRESNVLRVPFYNGKIISDLINAMPGLVELEILERSFKNKFGDDIKEDIIIARKGAISHETSMAKKIALKHLTLGIIKADPQTKGFIHEAIENIDSITPSPYFKTEDIINK